MNNYSILIIVSILIAIRIACHFMDKSRIQSFIENAGGKVLRISWRPFGNGWFGERGERHYEVSYQTADGLTTHANCKTSLFTGIYWTGDTLPRLSTNPAQITSQITCLQCGYSLQPSWKVCPICEKKR